MNSCIDPSLHTTLTLPAIKHTNENKRSLITVKLSLWMSGREVC